MNEVGRVDSLGHEMYFKRDQSPCFTSCTILDCIGSVHTLPVNFTFKISPQLPSLDKALNYIMSLSDGTSR